MSSIGVIRAYWPHCHIPFLWLTVLYPKRSSLLPSCHSNSSISVTFSGSLDCPPQITLPTVYLSASACDLPFRSDFSPPILVGGIALCGLLLESLGISYLYRLFCSPLVQRIPSTSQSRANIGAIILIFLQKKALLLCRRVENESNAQSNEEVTVPNELVKGN